MGLRRFLATRVPGAPAHRCASPVGTRTSPPGLDDAPSEVTGSRLAPKPGTDQVRLPGSHRRGASHMDRRSKSHRATRVVTGGVGRRERSWRGRVRLRQVRDDARRRRSDRRRAEPSRGVEVLERTESPSHGPHARGARTRRAAPTYSARTAAIPLMRRLPASHPAHRARPSPHRRRLAGPSAQTQRPSRRGPGATPGETAIGRLTRLVSDHGVAAVPQRIRLRAATEVDALLACAVVLPPRRE
jgi:hypothetical protein